MADGYTLLDFGDGRRLEQWGPYRLVRPDPTAQGRPADAAAWRSADGTYEGEAGSGAWRTRGGAALPKSWPVEFDDLRLSVRLAPYKHTGVFPEQRQNWRWMRERARQSGRPRLAILNLFAYTGGATVALARDGHFVTHVDASKPSIGWAKENAALNDLPGDAVRWILEDAATFVAREQRRGRRYDGILLDPPAFGHSPTGKAWRVERDLPPLLGACCGVLTEFPVFLVLNGYARQETAASVRRLVAEAVGRARPGTRFDVQGQDLRLAAADGRWLSTGVVARCAFR